MHFDPKVAHHVIENGGKVIFPFGPPIYQNYMSDDLHGKLLRGAMNVRDEEHSHSDMLAGNLYFGSSHHYEWSVIDDVKAELFEHLFAWFEFMHEGYGEKRLSFVPNNHAFDIKLTSLWVNFQRRYDFNPLHHHGGIVSLVSFLKVPEKIFEVQARSNTKAAGQISFQYGEAISPLSATGWSVKPSDKLILMFPATLNHFVPSFWADEERISVSGNFHIMGEPTSSLTGI